MSIRGQGFLPFAPSVAVGLAPVFYGFISGIWSQVEADDREDAMAAVAAYHRALAAQDSTGAVNFLAEDAIVLESGHAETLEGYLSHHLEADVQFASQVGGERIVL